MAKKKIPTGVKVIGVLYYIFSVLAILGGLMMFIGSGVLAGLLPLAGVFLGGLVILGGILMIALGILGFFIGRGLFGGQNWARILVIVFAVIGFISALTSLFSGDVGGGIADLIINGLIGWYLWFNNSVKAAFH